MKDLKKYKGIIPALYAAYDDEGKVSPERVQQLAKYYLEVGVNGLYVGGSSGECIYQTVAERKLVLENVMEAVGDKMTVIAHIASPSTDQSIELAKHAENLGVDALAAIPPIYYGLSDRAVEQYWIDIIEATDSDFFIYNIPSTTGHELSPKMFVKLLEYPQVVGVKNSSASVLDIQNFRKIQTRDTIIYSGVDEQYIAGRIMGADGGIGSTYGVMPKLYLQLEQLFQENKLEAAQELQFAINDIIARILIQEGSLYAVMKKVLEINEGIWAGHVRNPLPRTTKKDEKAIKEIAQMIKDAEEKYIG
ncbi:MAG: dihydrodipicolinate synthase family protein [Atopostipes suicloacalis]|nr:dihydrodipicolinate synthase family protein [Atopostipes suicloacalis]